MCLGHKCSNYFSNTGINARFFFAKTLWNVLAHPRNRNREGADADVFLNFQNKFLNLRNIFLNLEIIFLNLEKNFLNFRNFVRQLWIVIRNLWISLSSRMKRDFCECVCKRFFIPYIGYFFLLLRKKGGLFLVLCALSCTFVADLV